MPKGSMLKNGEVLARAKNRHEERTLNLHLKHLQQEHHILEDALVKEKQSLLQIRRNTFRTSGRSPVVEDLQCQGNASISKSHQILSKHFRKPWAFTFTETSYNAVYNDPFDPYMYRRQSVQDSRPVLPRVGCKSAPTGLRREGKTRAVSRPMTSCDGKNNILSPIQNRNVFSLQEDNVRGDPSENADSKEDATDVVQYGTQRSQSSVRTNTEVSSAIIRENRKQRSLSVTRPSTQDGDVVKRMHRKHRSHSVAAMEYQGNPPTGFDEVDFNNQDYVCSTDSTSVIRENVAPETIEEVNSKHKGNPSKCASHDSKKAVGDLAADNNGDVTLCDEDADPSVDTSKNHKRYILFKGKTIYNYVRPQDRYRHDPFKEVRRECLVRRVSIENPIFLNGYRESNFNFGINFPKAARDRALRQMVETNTVTTAERRRLVFQNATLQRRVQNFCQSSESPE